ncbi:hypothetical protein K7432_013474 [Basidiobolus ranarum]|uniref:AMIN domain-containing protein n=1 Tax=Basidiobolus ranarum TaxID=34480 RepID=A0ABR2WJC0_9FUNG
MLRFILPFFLLISLVSAQVSVNVAVPNGVYSIVRPQSQLITAQEGSPTSPASLLPPTGNPGEQEFEISRNLDGTVSIQNIRSRLYLSSKNVVNSLITLETQPKSWILSPGIGPSNYVIRLPGGPVDGQILVIDISLLRIFPPRLALRPFSPENVQRQQFRFERHE